MGPIEALRDAVAYVQWRWANEAGPDCVAFDALHGTDTAAWTLDYEPTPVPLAASLLSMWDGDPRVTTFVDLGCGKGRVCLQAARLPFREVIGVEWRRGLARTAARNAARDRGPGRVAPVRVVRGDAGTFALPAGNLLLFLFNPFDRDVVEDVVLGLADRPADAIYVHPRHADVFRAGGFRELRRLGAADVEDDWHWLRR
jgi:SAM-dependent methyltransferase